MPQDMFMSFIKDKKPSSRTNVLFLCKVTSPGATTTTTTITTTTAIPVTTQTKPLPRDTSPSARSPREDQRPNDWTPAEQPKNKSPSESDGTEDSNNQWNYIFIGIVSVMFLIIVIMFVFLYKRTRPKEKQQEKRKASTPNMQDTSLNEDASSRGGESERGRPATPAIPITDINLQERQPSPSRSSEAEQRNTANVQTDMLFQLLTLIQTLVTEGRNHRPGDAQHRTYPDPNAPLDQVFLGPHPNRSHPNGQPSQQYHYPPQPPSHHAPNHLLAHGSHPNPDPGHPHPHPHNPHPHHRHDQQPDPRRHPAPPNQPPSGEQSSRSSIYDLVYEPKNNKGKRPDPS